MRVKQLSYTRGATINIGDFESVRVDVSATADLDDGEVFDTAYAQLKETVDDAVREEVRRVRGKVAKLVR
jgi:hypothetical protein